MALTVYRKLPRLPKRASTLPKWIEQHVAKGIDRQLLEEMIAKAEFKTEQVKGRTKYNTRYTDDELYINAIKERYNAK